MTDRAPSILNSQQISQASPKYRFWDTSLAGPQRSPKNMSLLTASKDITQNKTQPQEKPSKQQELQGNKEDSDDEVNKSSSEEEPSELDSHEAKVQQMEEEIQRLRGQIEEGRVLNQNLLKELNKTTNQLRISESLNTELNEECDKIYSTVKIAHEKHSDILKQKMDLLVQISSLNQQKELAVNKSEINEEQVQYLNKKIESLYEEISFQKQMGADFNKQILILKQQLNKMMTMMQSYSQLQEQVKHSYAINSQIQDRVLFLEEELKNTRIQVEDFERNQQAYIEEQGKLFLRIQQLENQNKELFQKLFYAQSEIRQKNQQLATVQQYQSEPRYVKILEQYEKRNSDLVFQVMALNERNHKLIDQRDFYMRRVEAFGSSSIRNQRLPYDQFVSILKATDSQVQSLKRRLQLKDDEIEQIKNQFSNQSLNMMQKIRQLSNIIEIREREQQSQKQIIENQIQIYKKQCDHLMRKNQEIKSSLVKLRLEIMEKDRLIVQYVDRQKNETEFNRSRVESRHQNLSKSSN